MGIFKTRLRDSSPSQGEPSRDEHSKSRRLSTLGFAGRLSLSRPASEERSFQSIERTCADPERARIPMHAVHIGTSLAQAEDLEVPCPGILQFFLFFIPHGKVSDVSLGFLPFDSVLFFFWGSDLIIILFLIHSCKILQGPNPC